MLGFPCNEMAAVELAHLKRNVQDCDINNCLNLSCIEESTDVLGMIGTHIHV